MLEISGGSRYLLRDKYEKDYLKIFDGKETDKQLQKQWDDIKEFYALIKKHLRKKDKILEVGGGIGLLHVYLKHKGYNVISLEPNLSNYNDAYQIAKKIMEENNIDSTQFLNTDLTSYSKVSATKFDVVISHMVLEHIIPKDNMFWEMDELTRKGGIHIHETINYTIPYDPHSQKFILTYWKWLQEKIYGWRTNKLLETVNYVNHRFIENEYRLLGYRVYYLNLMRPLIARLMFDPYFQNKHGLIFNSLARFGLLNKLKDLPAEYTTPIAFVAKKNG